MPPLPRRSDLESLLQPGSFIWAAGIEDTFITDPHPVTGRTLDEYELTGHYENMQADMDRAVSLGVSAMPMVFRGIVPSLRVGFMTGALPTRR